MSDKFAGVLCKKLSLKARDGGISSALIMSRKMEAGCSGNVVQTKNTSNYAGQKKKSGYIYIFRISNWIDSNSTAVH